MEQTTVLIVDDEMRIVRFVSTSLQLAGYDTLAAYSGRSALQLFKDQQPDLIILDLGLPDIDGFDVLKRIRASSTVPLIILTARDSEQDKVRGLELGADDYLTKPFGTPELKARIEAVMRRARWSPVPSDLDEYKRDSLHIDFRGRRVRVTEEDVHLTPTEFDLLQVLVRNAGHVISHTELLKQVWGEEYRNDLAILRVNISRLRQKVEENPREPRFIVTVPGVGYMLPAD